MDEEEEESERRSGRSVGSNGERGERTKESLGKGGGRVAGSAADLKCRTVVSQTDARSEFIYKIPTYQKFSSIFLIVLHCVN
jgi:hypothetical protein